MRELSKKALIKFAVQWKSDETAMYWWWRKFSRLYRTKTTILDHLINNNTDTEERIILPSVIHLEKSIKELDKRSTLCHSVFLNSQLDLNRF